MAKVNLSTPSGRARLHPRREPYFDRLAKYQHLGFRRADDGGTWIAKFNDGAKRLYSVIGSEAEIPEYPEAQRRALEWFREVASEDRPDSALTVQQAIADYIADIKIRKSAESARRTEQTAGKHIIPLLGKIEVAKLGTKRLRAWRDGLIRTGDDAEAIRQSKDTANRTLSILKAALNLAFKDGTVREDSAWRRLKPFPDVSRAREVFLNAPQCAALLASCEPDFRAVVRSALLTGARYGEIIRRKAGDLDLRQCVLHVSDGKTGSRDIVLSDTAAAHFRELARDKLPAALLHYREQPGKDELTGELRAALVPWGKSEQSRRVKAAVVKANAATKSRAEKIPPGTVFYTLRHSYVSLALLAGVNVQILAENCGTSVAMIEKHYGKFRREDRRAMLNSVVSL